MTPLQGVTRRRRNYERVSDERLESVEPCIVRRLEVSRRVLRRLPRVVVAVP